MIALPKTNFTKHTDTLAVDKVPPLNELIANSWKKIAPFWPLKNLIAVNPLAGFEDLSFEEALAKAHAHFQQQDIPLGMQHVNRESIKWLQVFFDQGQSTISMPLRNQGFFKSTMSLIRFDKKVHGNDKDKLYWISHLSHQPGKVIAESLAFLGIASCDQELFITLMLTTLPGWAAHIQYRTSWADVQDTENPHTVTKEEYLAFRLVLTCLIWPQAKELLDWHRKALEQSGENNTYDTIVKREAAYQQSLLKEFGQVSPPQKGKRSDAQLVFCIDVRSEPFRRALEPLGNYETFGFAGFFGVPVSLKDPVTNGSYASCPVLIKPAYQIEEHPNNCSVESCREGYQNMQGLKRLYQSLKYTFTTPYSLVETLGLATGFWMAMRSISPRGALFIQSAIKKRLTPAYTVTPDLTAIPLAQQVNIGAATLKTMGLTENFAPLVVFCGHGSTTENNAYATALDCGACGGRHGAPNARVLAWILNNEEVRIELKKQEIHIPPDTVFLAAGHNTTTDEVVIFDEQIPGTHAGEIAMLKNDLTLAREVNCMWRGSKLGVKPTSRQAKQQVALRAIDWAQVRPEWGLAGNASFIVAPRWVTKNANLEGRSFLHSYDWEKDPDGASLKAILTAPMVVGQWINAQYLFSTLDNVAFGGGSKITKNITGKIGIMQGNAGDLMHGLPMQSIFKSDKEVYQQPVRLTVVVYAPKSRIDNIVQQHEVLQRLFRNDWVHMICYDPQDQQKYKLTRLLTWNIWS